MLKSNKNKGFTIIEALVAIAVLMMALGGPLVLAVSSIGDARASKNKVTAFYLAEEALEYVRNVRDSNFLQRTTETPPPTTPWLKGLDSCAGGSVCYVDIFNTTTPVDTTCGTSIYLKFNSGQYNCSVGTDSIFKRTVKITNPNGTTPTTGDEVKVEVKVEWDEHGSTRNVALTQNMFNLAP